MALYKRGTTWWSHFFLNGARYRQSLHTTDRREAVAREKEVISQAEQGKLAPAGRNFSRLAFSEACDRFLDDRKAGLAPRTIQTERERRKPLVDYFGARPLQRIRSDEILAYRAARKKSGISNATLNRELDLVRGVLKRARLWHLVSMDVRPLPMRRNVGRALSHGDKMKLLKTCAKRPEWQVARLATILALNTTMRGCELKGLLWRDIDLIERTLTVRRSKTEAGERVIPLNPDAFAAVLELRDRSRRLFGGDQFDPYWHVFPHFEGYSRPDPARPMRGWRTAWRKLTRAAGLPGLRFHDLRHSAITELAEGQASDSTIRSIAGHVSQQMLEHYSHIRIEAKRRALDALSCGSQSNTLSDPVRVKQTSFEGGLRHKQGHKLGVCPFNQSSSS
jgi:integrase